MLSFGRRGGKTNVNYQTTLLQDSHGIEYVEFQMSETTKIIKGIKQTITLKKILVCMPNSMTTVLLNHFRNT